LHANWRLSQLISTRIGSAWTEHAFGEIAGLRRFVDDDDFLDALANVKRHNKRTLAAFLEGACGVKVDPASMFIVQVKRIHEYKRQLLAILHVIALYREMRRAPAGDFVPRTFIFGGKAAAGYQSRRMRARSGGSRPPRWRWRSRSRPTPPRRRGCGRCEGAVRSAPASRPAPGPERGTMH
jgi:glucan phosphorylase